MQYARINDAELTFAGGWKDGEFDVRRLSLKEQGIWGELEGTFYDLTSNVVWDNHLRVIPWSYEQVGYIASTLEPKKDFTVFERKDGAKDLYIRNRSFGWYFPRSLPGKLLNEVTKKYNIDLTSVYHWPHPLPEIGPAVIDGLIRGVVTSSIQETLNRNRKPHDKVIWQTRLKEIALRMRAYMGVRHKKFQRLTFDTLDIPPRKGKDEWEYTTWFYDPKDLKNWIIPHREFENLPEELDKLNDYSSEEMRETRDLEKMNLRSLRGFDLLVRQHLYDPKELTELIGEGERAKRLLREIRYRTKELKGQTSVIESFGEDRSQLLSAAEALDKKKEELEAVVNEVEEILRVKREAMNNRKKEHDVNWQARAAWKKGEY